MPPRLCSSGCLLPPPLLLAVWGALWLWRRGANYPTLITPGRVCVPSVRLCWGSSCLGRAGPVVGAQARSWKCEPCVGTKPCPMASGLHGLALEMSFWLPAPPAAWKWQQAPIQPQGFERRRLNCGLEGRLHSSLVALRSSLALATAHTKTRSARARPGLRGREQWGWLGILRCLIKVVLRVPRSTPGSPRAVPGGSNAAGN